MPGDEDPVQTDNGPRPEDGDQPEGDDQNKAPDLLPEEG